MDSEVEGRSGGGVDADNNGAIDLAGDAARFISSTEVDSFVNTDSVDFRKYWRSGSKVVGGNDSFSRLAGVFPFVSVIVFGIPFFSVFSRLAAYSSVNKN